MSLPFVTATMNLAALVSQQAQRLPDHPAFVWGKSVWDWQSFDRRVAAMAQVLATHGGIGKGDPVLVQSPNCNQLFESFFACLRLGAIWVPANFRGLPDDLAWMAELSGAKALICHADFPDHAAIDAPLIRSRFAIGSADFGPDLDELMTECQTPSPPPVAVDRDDPAWYFFTSGTTGRPKASVLTHGQLGFVINNHLADLVPGLSEQDASIVVAPLSHGAGLHQILMVARGVPTILPASARFDAAEIWALIEVWRVSTFFSVPTILKMLVDAPEAQTANLSSLRYVIYAGAPIYRTDQIKAQSVLGDVLVQYFGLGEVTGAITYLPPNEHATDDTMRVGTCGRPRTGMEITIQSDTGEHLLPRATGEICVKGPAVFAGYLDNPAANAKSFRDGWFRTGDLGYLDDAGYLFITGRASDMYISGGSNIYPLEIENKILELPAVGEVAVFGMPDPKWGEIGVAICAPKAGESVDLDAVTAHLKSTLASYKIPKTFYVWEALPKTGYGKLAKRIIRAELERRLQAEGAAE